MHLLKEIVRMQKEGKPAGIYSCCSANSYVIEAVFERAKANKTFALIESTANQVDQFGGYTGMKPVDFYKYVISLAQKVGIDKKQVVLGGDHLGPLTWSSLDDNEAMQNAEELIRQYVLAGFTKIHIDTSMRLGGDSRTERLSDSTIAARGARLCAAAESAYRCRLTEHRDSEAPVYIIGSEVPIPGGTQEKEEAASLTSPQDCINTYKVFHEAFLNAGLTSAWQRVIGMVVQLGVEFGDTTVFEYNREKVKDLTVTLKTLPIIFEGHSTDFQNPENLKHMVEDGVAILKVGPALTFAFREALIALENIEKEMYAGTGVHLSDLRAVIEHAMLENDRNWIKYYHGDGNSQRFSRCFSFSDRVRYYLPEPCVESATNRLINNLRKRPIPDVLISQYMPIQYYRVRRREISNDPEALIKDKIRDCIDQYLSVTIKFDNSKGLTG